MVGVLTQSILPHRQESLVAPVGLAKEASERAVGLDLQCELLVLFQPEVPGGLSAVLRIDRSPYGNVVQSELAKAGRRVGIVRAPLAAGAFPGLQVRQVVLF